MALTPGMSLSDIIAHELPKKNYGINDGGISFVHGDPKLVELSFGVAVLYKEVYHTLLPQFNEFVAMEGIKVPNDAHHIKLFFGITDIGEGIAAANYYIPLKGSYTSRLFNIILFKEDVYRDIITKKRGLAKLYMLHEICHSLYHLEESKTYSLISKFYHHMGEISTGAAKREYHSLAKIAKILHDAYNKNPYEAHALALNYVNKELSRTGISKEYRSYLLDMKSYLANRVKESEKNYKGKKAETKKAELKKGDAKDTKKSGKKGDPPSKKGKSTKQSNSAKAPSNSGKSSSCKK